MTVAELIGELRSMPLSAEVWCATSNHVDVIERVELDVAGDVIIRGETMGAPTR